MDAIHAHMGGIYNLMDASYIVRTPGIDAWINANVMDAFSLVGLDITIIKVRVIM